MISDLPTEGGFEQTLVLSQDPVTEKCPRMRGWDQCNACKIKRKTPKDIALVSYK